MSNIKKWGYINKIYDECSRGAILSKEFKKNRIYWLCGIVYFSISLLALCFSQTYFLGSVAAIAVTGLCIYYLIEYQLSKSLVELYKQNGLKGVSLFPQTTDLSYILFRERLKKEKIVNSSDVDSMILWDEIKNEKIDTSVFFTSKWFLILVTGIIGFIVQFILGLNLSPKYVAVIAYLGTVVLWFFWIIFGFLNTKKKKRLEVYKFLKLFKLDSEET